MAKFSIHIVSWNSASVLGEALESLRAQTLKDFTLTVVDNASTDGSVDVVREHLPETTVLRNFKNLGFCHAHNQAIELARNRWADDDRKNRSSVDRYVLVMNPDIILMPEFLENLASGVDGRFEVGSACGKLLRVRRNGMEGADSEFTDIIDSTGLVIRRDRRAADRGAGENDGPDYSNQEEIFGVPGALALYRAEAIELLRETSGEVFDEDFFAYKEDVDIAWRLRLLGWKSLFVPNAMAYHYRGTGGSDKASLVDMFKRRLGRSSMVNRLSTRNHLLMLTKVDDWSSRLLHAVWTVPHEIGKFVSTLLLSPASIGAYWEVFLLIPKMLKKRDAIIRARKTSAKEIRAWFK